MNSEWQKYLGLAQKAGAVIFGIDNILSHKKKIYLILLDDTASANLISKAQNFAEQKNITLIKLQKSLDEILHSTNCKIIGISNINLANQIKQLINEE